ASDAVRQWRWPSSSPPRVRSVLGLNPCSGYTRSARVGPSPDDGRPGVEPARADTGDSDFRATLRPPDADYRFGFSSSASVARFGFAPSASSAFLPLGGLSARCCLSFISLGMMFDWQYGSARWLR